MMQPLAPEVMRPGMSTWRNLQKSAKYTTQRRTTQQMVSNIHRACSSQSGTFTAWLIFYGNGLVVVRRPPPKSNT
jgi:hypothetical protein